jgi:penicillin-binding protein 2
MGSVVNDANGTAAKYFKDFKYKYYIGGKTGTAEITTIDLENNSWFVCFAPYKSADAESNRDFKEYDLPEKPEIVVVVYVPHGYTGGVSSYIAQDIVEFYLDRAQKVSEQTIPGSNSVVN